jgi:transcriptional regulator with XRE-family HTH domain
MENTKIDLIKLGHRVRFYRTGKGWSISRLAEQSGVSKAYISDLENGAAGNPNVQYVYSIASALDVTLNDLLEDATPRTRVKPRKSPEDLPPGLEELKRAEHLTDEEVHELAQISFRGNRPKDMEGWRFLLQTMKLLSQRNPQQ